MFSILRANLFLMLIYIYIKENLSWKALIYGVFLETEIYFIVAIPILRVFRQNYPHVFLESFNTNNSFSVLCDCVKIL